MSRLLICYVEDLKTILQEEVIKSLETFDGNFAFLVDCCTTTTKDFGPSGTLSLSFIFIFLI